MRPILILALSCFSYCIYSQTVLFNNGETVFISEGTEIIVVGGDLENSLGEISNNGLFTIDGNLINDSELIGGVSGSEFILSEDWINNSQFSAGLSNTRLVGGDQLIEGISESTFYDLNLENTGVKSIGINANILGSLGLNELEFYLDNFKLSILNPDPNAIAFVENAGFISSEEDGRLLRQTNTTNSYVFPLGATVNGLKYRPINISPSTSNDLEFESNLIYDNAQFYGYDLNSSSSDLGAMNDHFFHHINQVGGNTESIVQIFYDPNVEGSWESIARWQSIQWEDLVATNIGSNANLSFVAKSDWLNDGNEPHLLVNLIDEPEGELYAIPNAFAPFGSQSENQNFSIINQSNAVELVFMQIFDRWGEKVFDSEEQGVDQWDGRYNGELQPNGSYTYLLQVRKLNGEELSPVSGNVLMLW